MERAGVKGAWCALAIVLASAPSVMAQTKSFLKADDLSVGGYTDFGRFQLNEPDANGEIISRVGARWHIDKTVNENLNVMADLHWLFWRNQATDLSAFWIAGQKFDADVQAALAYTVGKSRIKGGLYDFKYNPDSKNLGEYLLRSEAYPTTLESSQGKDLLADATTRIAGVEYQRVESSVFNHKAVLYAEQFSQPLYDLNLVYLATFSSGPFEFGAGAAWARIVSLDQQSRDYDDPPMHDYIERQGLEVEAVKLSLRGRVDLAPTLGLRDNFVLYSEVALLGLKNDSLFYKDVMERVPMMVGVSLPTAGILTTFAVEAEYLKNPYYQKRHSYKSNYGVSPLPDLEGDYTNLPDYSKDDWRWSILAHRAVNKWLDLKLRVASDHMRLRNYDGDYEGGRPMTKTSGEWYFLARVEFHN